MALTTVLTLFVVPAAYSVIARNTQSPGHVTKKLEKLQQQVRGRRAEAGQDPA
jgi:multidrug efflux pump